MTMLCTLIRGQMSYTFFSWGAHVLLRQLLGGTCPHMPFFIGRHMSGGGGGGGGRNVLHSVRLPLVLTYLTYELFCNNRDNC